MKIKNIKVYNDNWKILLAQYYQYDIMILYRTLYIFSGVCYEKIDASNGVSLVNISNIKIY